MTLTYSTYLRLDELLELQQPRSDGPEHDEMLFIVIHQVFELWFKEMLHELDHLKTHFEKDDDSSAQATLKRILTILKIQVAQIDVLETMTPLQFQSFRDRLEKASGFQSSQFRELEFVLGHKRPGFMEHFPKDSAAYRRLHQRYCEACLWDTFLERLVRQGSDLTKPIKTSSDVQTALIAVYRNGGSLSRICELLTDLDEGFQEWRYRHMKMVERTIGGRKGTGGSSGAEYLKSTLFTPVFPDLWAIRSEL